MLMLMFFSKLMYTSYAKLYEKYLCLDDPF